MLEIGSVIDGKYRILSEIGHGGMSVVYMAINEKVNKTWAVKEVRKDGKMDFNTVRQGLMAEIETLKKLKHPNLPSIVDVIEDADSFIIVMDYIEGRSLDKILEENGAQPESFVVEWAKQLCDVFGYLHSRTPPIIYRDMKPANIMLKPDGNIMVIDFGTAKNYEIDLGETTGIGTIGYAAPEQYIGSGLGRTDARTDIYCLGITMYHLLTSIDPCKNIISDKSIRAVNPALSHGLDAIIQKCTQHQPSDRYQSCAELMYDLENYEILEPLYKKKQKNKLKSFGLTVIMAIVMAIAGVGLNISASQMATDTYLTKLDEAEKATDYDTKVELYEECISIPGKAGEKDAYLGLIKAFKDDSLFSEEEDKRLRIIWENNKAELQKDSEIYTDICFEIGKLYWYYYSYAGGSQISNAKSAKPWFKDIIDSAPEDYENKGMANVYYNIGDFYENITLDVTEANEKGKYKAFFKNLSELVSTVATDENEAEIVRLELIEFASNEIQKYATKFKKDGVAKEELMDMYSLISDAVESVDASEEMTQKMKASVLSNLSNTLSNIEKAYITNKEGNEYDS